MTESVQCFYIVGHLVFIWSGISNFLHLGATSVSAWSGASTFLDLLQLGTFIAKQLTSFYMTGNI